MPYPQKRLTIAALEKPLLPDHPVMADIDAHAAMLLGECARAIKAILDHRAALDKAGQADEPLLVALGESHDQPAYRIAAMTIMESVRRAEPRILYGREINHNKTAQSFCRMAGLPATSSQSRELAPALERGDQDGTLTAIAMALTPTYFSPYTGLALEQFLMESRLPSFNTDAARISVKGCPFLLDPADASTQASIRERKKWHDMREQSISGTDPAGIDIRNHHMAATLYRHAITRRARIAFQTCGRGHIQGGQTPEGKTALKEHSLMSHYRRINPHAAHAVTSMNTTTDEAEAASITVLRTMPDTFVSHDPENTTYWKYDRSSDYPDELSCIEHESAYTNALMERLGLGRYVIPEKAYSQFETRCKGLFLNRMQKLAGPG